MSNLLSGEKIMPFAKVLRGGQITLPKKIRDILGVKEGDVLEVDIRKKEVFLKPKVLADRIPESELELSVRGKEKIKEALEAYEKGEVLGPFTSVKGMKKAFK